MPRALTATCKTNNPARCLRNAGMDYLFSEAGSQALDFASVGPTLFAFDLDELLAPGAPPLPDETRQALQELSRSAAVAVISTRERSGVLERLSVDVSYIVGRDGEGLPGSHMQRGQAAAEGLPPSRQEALNRLLALSRCRKALFVGTSRNDDPVFESAPSHWMTVHVGTGYPSQARWFVNDEQELASLLRAILARRAH